MKNKEIQLDFNTAVKNYIKAIDKGLLKIMSKMGIATITSYKGAQLFEAIGLSQDIIDAYFGNTISKIGGIDITDLANEILTSHEEAFSSEFDDRLAMLSIGQYSY